MPRQLDAEKLVSGLAAFKAENPLNVRIYHHTSPEPAQLAQWLLGIFVVAGYYHNVALEPQVSTRPFYDAKGRAGITVADEPDQGRALHAVLRQCGVACSLRHLHMHKPHEKGPSERQGPERSVGTEELLIEVWPE